MPTLQFGRRAALAALMMAVLLVGTAPHGLADKYDHIERVQVRAALTADGSMQVVESRTYDFHGTYRYAVRTLPIGGHESYRDIHISEDGQAYELSDNEQPGTFTVREKGSELEIRWFFRAGREARTFDVHFTVADLVRRHEDAAVLYYQFMGSAWQEPSRNVSLTILPPGETSSDDVRAWLHGPLWAELSPDPDGVITAFCELLPKRTFLEVRALYAPGLFRDAASVSGPVRAQIMNDEAAWAEDANRRREAAAQHHEVRRERQALGFKLFPVVGVIGIFIWVLLYRRYGSRPQVMPTPDMAPLPPSDTPPAMVGYLIHSRQVYARDLVATFLDLARRGFVSIREEEHDRRTLFGRMKKVKKHYWVLNRTYYRQHAGDLLDYEDALIRFLFDELAQGADEITPRMIAKRRRQFRMFFRQWRRQVTAHAKRKEYYNRESLRGRAFSFALGGVMVAASLLALLYFGSSALVLTGSGILVTFLSLAIPHRNAPAEIEARQWKALGRYLRGYHFRASGQADLLTRFDRYLVSAVVLGLGVKVIRELAVQVPTGAATTHVPWYVGTLGGQGFSPDAFASGFSTMVSSANSAVSSASGTGGGASSGGGGGAGGGGGGAG